MRFDPAKGLELDLLGSPPTAADFIEQTNITTAPREGWAPPRKRPRRVYKKLAARGFRAHCDGPVLFDGEQVRTTRRTAPELARWLECGDLEDPATLVRFRPLMFDSNRTDVPMSELRHAPALPVHCHEMVIPVIDRPRAGLMRMGDPADVLTFRKRRFPAIDICLDVTCLGRRFRAILRVYAEQGVSEALIRNAARERSPAELSHVFKHAMSDLAMALIEAAQGITSRRVIAKHTSYRRSAMPLGWSVEPLDKYWRGNGMFAAKYSRRIIGSRPGIEWLGEWRYSYKQALADVTKTVADWQAKGLR